MHASCTRLQRALLNVLRHAEGVEGVSHHGAGAVAVVYSVCSTRTGPVGTNAVARDPSAYYAGEQTMASYYGRHGDIRADVSAAMAAKLGLDPTRPSAQAEVANLMLGMRVDGQEIAGRARRTPTRMGHVSGQPSSISPGVPARCRLRSRWRRRRRNMRP